MKFASRIGKVSPSVTLGLNARTLELKKQGRDIVSLGVGEPDIDTPDVICQAAHGAIDRRECRYTATAGIPELRQAICRYIKGVYGLDYTPDCVMASSGAKQVLFNSIMMAAGEGDEVIIPTPYWTSYPEMVHLAGGTPVPVVTTVADGLKLTPERLEAAITPRTTAVMLNSPSNPTGVTYTMDDLLPLAEVLRNRDIWILSDDIYCTLLFDGMNFASLASIPELRDKTVLINGVSKTFSMTGWRIGFAAGSKEAIAAMTRIQDHATSCPNSIAQKAAAVALHEGPALTSVWISDLERRRDRMRKLAEGIPGVSVIPPTGAFYLFLDVSAHVGPGRRAADTMQLSEGLLVEAGVSTIPGEAFGAPGFIRLSFAVNDYDIDEGMRRIGKYLHA